MRFNPGAIIGSMGATEQGFIDSSLSDSISTITPTLLVQPPLICVVLSCNGPQSGGRFTFSTDEVGVAFVFQLFHTPIPGNLAPAPISNATLEMHLRPLADTDISMVSAPSIVYAPFAIGEMVFQSSDMALLPGGIYRAMVRATLSDGQIRDFIGPTVAVTMPNPSSMW